MEHIAPRILRGDLDHLRRDDATPRSRWRRRFAAEVSRTLLPHLQVRLTGRLSREVLRGA